MLHPAQFDDILYKRQLLEAAQSALKAQHPDLAISFLQAANETEHFIETFNYSKACKFIDAYANLQTRRSTLPRSR